MSLLQPTTVPPIHKLLFIGGGSCENNINCGLCVGIAQQLPIHLFSKKIYSHAQKAGFGKQHFSMAVWYGAVIKPSYAFVVVENIEGLPIHCDIESILRAQVFFIFQNRISLNLAQSAQIPTHSNSFAAVVYYMWPRLVHSICNLYVPVSCNAFT